MVLTIWSAKSENERQYNIHLFSNKLHVEVDNKCLSMAWCCPCLHVDCGQEHNHPAPGLATCSRWGEISAHCRQCTPAHWHGDKVRPGRVLWGMLTLRSTQLLMLVFRAASPAAAAFIQNFKLYLRVTNDNKVILVCEAPGGFRWQWMKTKSVWQGFWCF